MNFRSILLPNITDQRPLIISGPCSAETEIQVMTTAKELSAAGVQIFRAGVWKPRTKPGGFEGAGTPALKWLQQVKKEIGMYTTTEVANEKHVHEALKHNIDILWIGARTAANPFAVQEIANTLSGVDIPVLIKNPINPDLELWIGAVERLYNVGICRLGVVHRGFSSSDKSVYRNAPQWQIPIELKRRFPTLPIFCDPSHIAGKRNLLLKICQQAMDLNYCGLMIESHSSPDDAWSDKEQQITPLALKELLHSLIIRNTAQTTEGLSAFRSQMDELDQELLRLLSNRMCVSRNIGQYKLDHNMPVLQANSYDHTLNDLVKQAEQMDLPIEFMKQILESIHAESIRQQIEVMERKK